MPWIPTWQGLKVFKKYLRPCAFDKSSLGIGRINFFDTIIFTFHTSIWYCIKWQYLARAIQWIPTWQGLGFQKSLQPCAMDENGLGIGRINFFDTIKKFHIPYRYLVLYQVAVPSESYPINTNMTRFRLFSKIVATVCYGRKWPWDWKD